MLHEMKVKIMIRVHMATLMRSRLVSVERSDREIARDATPSPTVSVIDFDQSP